LTDDEKELGVALVKWAAARPVSHLSRRQDPPSRVAKYAGSHVRATWCKPRRDAIGRRAIEGAAEGGVQRPWSMRARMVSLPSTQGQGARTASASSSRTSSTSAWTRSFSSWPRFSAPPMARPVAAGVVLSAGRPSPGMVELRGKFRRAGAAGQSGAGAFRDSWTACKRALTRCRSVWCCYAARKSAQGGAPGVLFGVAQTSCLRLSRDGCRTSSEP